MRTSRSLERPLLWFVVVEGGLVLRSPLEQWLKAHPALREEMNRTVREERSARLRVAYLGYACHDADRPGSGFLRTKTLLKVYALKHFP